MLDHFGAHPPPGLHQAVERRDLQSADVQPLKNVKMRGDARQARTLLLSEKFPGRTRCKASRRRDRGGSCYEMAANHRESERIMQRQMRQHAVPFAEPEYLRD